MSLASDSHETRMWLACVVIIKYSQALQANPRALLSRYHYLWKELIMHTRVNNLLRWSYKRAIHMAQVWHRNLAVQGEFVDPQIDCTELSRGKMWYTDLIIVLSACLYISVYVMPLVFLYCVYGIVISWLKFHSINQQLIASQLIAACKAQTYWIGHNNARCNNSGT